MVIFLVLVLLFFGRSLAIKCLSMNNQSCMVKPRFIDLNPDELHYHPFIISMNRCNESWFTVEDPFVRICVPNKMDMKLKVFNIIKEINESKSLTKHISCDCKCEFDSTKSDSRKKWDNDRCLCECKKPIKYGEYKKDYTWNPRTCACKCDKDFEIGEHLKER